MRLKKVTITGVANSAWIPVDREQTPFNIGFGCTIDSGTATYTVQHTFDDVYDPNVTPVAFNNSSVAAKTTNADGNYAFPVTAIRLSVSAGSSPVVSMAMIQGVKA